MSGRTSVENPPSTPRPSPDKRRAAQRATAIAAAGCPNQKTTSKNAKPRQTAKKSAGRRETKGISRSMTLCLRCRPQPPGGVRVELMVRVRPHVRSAGSEREGCRGLSTRRDAPVLILRAPAAAMMAPLEPGLRPQGSAAQAAPMVRRATRSGREQVSEAQRARIVSAMVRVASDHGVQSASVTRVRSEAGVSGKTFYAIFEDRNDCLFAAIEQAWALAGERASAAYTTQQAWVDSVRAGLLALLELFDEEPGLARLCVVDTLAALPTALARRGELLKQLARVIDRGRDCSSREPPPLAAEGVVGGALGVIDAWLRQPDPRPLGRLLDPPVGVL